MGLTILSMEDYPKLMEYLPFDKRKDVAVKICEAVVSL
jgi:vacuolar protein sorting-associated protein 35